MTPNILDKHRKKNSDDKQNMMLIKDMLLFEVKNG